MKNIPLLFAFCILSFAISAQTIQQKLQAAYQQFEADSQLRHAISSLYVINAKTGEVVFDKNSQIGMSGASTQKIIIATTAFELLGKDYRYQTDIGYIGDLNSNGVLRGDIVIRPSGDPTLGSWRWKNTTEDSVFFRIIKAIQNKPIKSLNVVAIDKSNWETVTIPDGWTWGDISNYYGAPANKFNWRENQFDIILRSGKKVNDAVEIVGYNPNVHTVALQSKLSSAPKGTGDNAYVYFPLSGYTGFIQGTIPIEEDHFVISASMPNVENDFTLRLLDSLCSKKICQMKSEIDPSKFQFVSLHTETSPTLDSIIYWFLKRSINLYGEALVKTLAYEKKGFGSTDSGVVIVKDFWKQKGLDPEEINIKDGSGLSPQNRITTHVQVEILKYAKQQSWFPYFFDALPEFNNMKMKSGTINDVKGFCGYHTSGDGNEYIFSFLVNNYNGRSSTVVNKMYKVLDVLK
jgi:D-alanyl-D-alanine carboxypeptidase/D-alanyl-D-alanine-endopeptidase (penicillin-binding protein 4)